MELTDLLTFSTVARLGGITRAADELNTVQSNVTQRVKALEAEIGTALVRAAQPRHDADRRRPPPAALCAADGRAVARGAAGRARRWRTEGTARDRIDGDDGRGAPAVAARRIPSPLSGGAAEPADLDHRRPRGRRARRHVRRRLRRRSDRACRTRCNDRVPGRTGAGHRAALDKPRARCAPARRSPDRPRWCSAPAAPTGSGSSRSLRNSAGRRPRGSNSARSTA